MFGQWKTVAGSAFVVWFRPVEFGLKLVMAFRMGTGIGADPRTDVRR